MTESDARDALLVRAWETAPAGEVQWTDDDRAWASRAAAEVEGEHASADAFIARRARLASERIASRDRRVGRTLRAVTWRPRVAWLVAIVALLFGIATDAIGSSQRINVLAPPLLMLMLWNLLVYGAIALRWLAGPFRRRHARPPDALAQAPASRASLIGPMSGPLSRLIARAAHLVAKPRKAADEAAPLARFLGDWAHASAHLNTTRIARLLHVGAIVFALGALAGMYVRGLAFEYRAGWESTFLDASTVGHLLRFVLGMASSITGIALPDVARLEAMRFPETIGEPAAGWIHLYAVTVVMVIVFPRLVLTAIDLGIERRLTARFPLALDSAYFSALDRSLRGETARVVLVPYIHEPSPQTALVLRELLGQVLGAATELRIVAPVAYGDEDAAGERLAAQRPPPSLAIVLISSTATPEPDTHGALVGALSSALPATTPLLPMIDESPFLARFGNQDPTAVRRRDERRQAWVRMLAACDRRPLFVELERPATPAAVRQLRAALEPAAGLTTAH